MKFKNENPIKFEIFQSDMEKIMHTLNELNKIREDLQHKINIHRERGEWK